MTKSQWESLILIHLKLTTLITLLCISMKMNGVLLTIIFIANKKQIHWGKLQLDWAILHLLTLPVICRTILKTWHLLQIKIHPPRFNFQQFIEDTL